MRKTALVCARSHRLLEQMATLMARLWRGLDASEKANSPAALVAFAREVRQCLESYSGISNSRLTQAGATGTALANRIAQARGRLKEARDRSEIGEPSLASLPAASPKPV
jgi:hypothetical protein